MERKFKVLVETGFTVKGRPESEVQAVDIYVIDCVKSFRAIGRQAIKELEDEVAGQDITLTSIDPGSFKFNVLAITDMDAMVDARDKTDSTYVENLDQIEMFDDAAVIEEV